MFDRFKRLSFLVLPACVLALYALWTQSPWGMQLEERLGLEPLFQWRGERPAPPQVLVVAITRESAQALGLSGKLYEWSRAQHAQAVTRLHEAGVRLIVFDVFFEQARDAAGDQEFADAIRQAGNVLLFARAERQVIDLGDGHRADRQSIVEPLPLLGQSALATAPLILPKIPARVNRFFVRHPATVDRLTLHALAFEWVNGNRTIQSHVLRDWPDSLLYNFYGPPRSITTIEYSTLLQQPHQVADLLRNAVVFIGYSAYFQPDQRDGFYTAFTADTGLDISGVELAATAFANLRDSSFLREPGVLFSAGLVWCYGLLMFAIARTVMPVPSALLLLVSALCASVVVYHLFAEHFLWLPWFNGVLLLTPLAGGWGMWLRSRELQTQKSRLQRAFGKYLPAAEIRRLVTQAELPASQEHHHSVCLVTDAQGYSRLSEQLTPVELSNLMQDYYAAVIGPIRDGKGLISDVAGDGVIALWPHLERAQAWSTLEPVINAIQEKVQAFNQRHPQHMLPTRIGIHAGEIVLGHFGAADHYEFRAMGDIVNTTARLDGVNKQIGTQVLVSEDCLESAGEKMRDLGRVKFVGKQNPLRIYTPVSHEAGELLFGFDAALAVFESGDWQQAAQQFGEVASRFPADGPSRFYAEFLAGAARNPDLAAACSAGVITLLQK